MNAVLSLLSNFLMASEQSNSTTFWFFKKIQSNKVVIKLFGSFLLVTLLGEVTVFIQILKNGVLEEQ